MQIDDKTNNDFCRLVHLITTVPLEYALITYRFFYPSTQKTSLSDPSHTSKVSKPYPLYSTSLHYPNILQLFLFLYYYHHHN